MLKNYFISSFRNLWKNKFHSSINIIGLSIALGVCLLIVQFLKVELSFDSFHENKENIYRLTVKEEWSDGEVLNYPVSSFIVGDALAESYPDAVQRVQYLTQNGMIRNNSGEGFSESIALGTSNYFEVFDFDLEPSGGDYLSKINSVVMTRDYAEKYFGTSDVVGKILDIRMGNEFEPYEVTAVIEDFPYNSSLQFNLMIPMENARKVLPASNFEAWFFGLIETYIELDTDFSKTEMEEKFNSTIASILSDRADKVVMTVWLQPLSEMHVNSEFRDGIARVTEPTMLYILGGVALLILLIACINFTTMAISRAAARGHEVGIRKSIGASKGQLVLQYMTEALVLTCISILAGVFLAELMESYFNQLFNTEIALALDFFVIATILALILLVTVAAGFYPSLVLASFKPIKILRNQLNISGKSNLRKSLVVFQFVMSLMLIASTLIMQKQMQFLKNKDLGYDKDLLLTADLNCPNVPGISALLDTGFYKSELIKNELSSYPQILTGTSSQTFGTGTWMELGFENPEGKDPTFKFNIVDVDYIPVMGIKLVQGENFRQDNPDFNSKSMIVNETFVREYKMENVLGEQIPGGKFPEMTIIGVVEDFHYESLHQKVKPMIMATSGRAIFPNINNFMMDTDPAPDLLIRLTDKDPDRGIALVSEAWAKVFPGEKFNYSFIDENLAEQYRNENNLSRLITSAAILAIFIAAMGLFAITALTLSGRNKEIGIRKVLGATSGSITYLLTREFLIMLLLSFAISVPISYYMMNKWLLKFEFQTDIGVWLFALVALIGLVFTLLTVSTQAFKASLRNPVHSIREE